jgi:hypothetical protein
MTRIRRRTPSRPLAGVLAGIVALAAVAAAGPKVSDALFVDAAATTASVTAETLDPPTAVVATVAGPTVTLTWTPTVDAARASGYEVLRGTTSGGPYAQVGSVSPATASSTTDSPGSGTFTYVLRTSAGTSWLSTASNEATAIVGARVSTDTKDCTSNAADTGGDGNGYQTDPGRACADGGGEAVDTNSGSGSSTSCTSSQKDRHRFWGYTFGLPGSVASVDDIEVRLDARMDSLAGKTHMICVELSWDGGSSWTSPQSTDITSTSEQTYLLSGLWGRTWSAGELSSANFRIRLTDVSNNVNRDFYLDFAGVAVTYTP